MYDCGASFVYWLNPPHPPGPHLDPPHYSHLPNWMKRLLDVSQRGFIVRVCDSDV